MKGRLATWLSRSQRLRLRKAWADMRAIFVRSDLSRLAALYPTDKLEHGYMPIYQAHFQRLRKKTVRLLEIGIGGYGDPWAGGGSLRLWEAYFPHGQVFGLDIEDKTPHARGRVSVFRGKQGDRAFLAKMIEKTGALDIVIDDGSHFCSDVITSFETLFPHLRTGGIYVIEDTQTSYWAACGGSMDPSAMTTMNHFKRLVDGLNHAEFPLQDYKPSETDRCILSIHFYHNLIVVEKGLNTRPSNVSIQDRMTAGRT